jgi:hypothetical protein
MPLSNTSMASKIIAQLDALGYTVEDLYNSSVRQRIWEAICQGIIEEITQNARAVGTDSRGDSHELNII